MNDYLKQKAMRQSKIESQLLAISLMLKLAKSRYIY